MPGSSRNPFAIAKKFQLFALGFVNHKLTGEATTLYFLRRLKGGGFLNVLAEAATGALTVSTNPADGETVTIGAVVYTFEAVFTDTAFAVLIGATLADSLYNLASAINALSNEAGETHGTGTTQHATVMATSDDVDTLTATARLQGTAGNSIASATTLADGEWTAATLLGGTAGRGVDVKEGWTFGSARTREGMAVANPEAAAERVFTVAHGILTLAQARATAVIERGDSRYIVAMEAEPEGLEQAWVFRVDKREAV